MNFSRQINQYFGDIKSVLQQLDPVSLQPIVTKIQEAMHQNHALYIFGNGGCAALASHFCADLGKMMKLAKNQNYRITALTDNMPSITAWANDTGYENIFWRQLELYLQKDDLVIALSGSGNSMNVIKAIEYARGQGHFTIGLAGFGGGKLATVADLCYVVPSHNMQVVEDVFGIILHAIFVALRA